MEANEYGWRSHFDTDGTPINLIKSNYEWAIYQREGSEKYHVVCMQLPSDTWPGAYKLTLEEAERMTGL